MEDRGLPALPVHAALPRRRCPLRCVRRDLHGGLSPGSVDSAEPTPCRCPGVTRTTAVLPTRPPLWPRLPGVRVRGRGVCSSLSFLPQLCSAPGIELPSPTDGPVMNKTAVNEPHGQTATPEVGLLGHPAGGVYLQTQRPGARPLLAGALASPSLPPSLAAPILPDPPPRAPRGATPGLASRGHWRTRHRGAFLLVCCPTPSGWRCRSSFPQDASPLPGLFVTFLPSLSV